MRRIAPKVLVIAACLLPGCGADDPGQVLPGSAGDPPPAGFRLLARFAHLSDAQIIDEESPARFAPLDGLVAPAWRPQEAYSVHLLDGMVRAINREHRGGRRVDFAIHTGDAADNDQLNEWRWFLAAIDGGVINPLSGQDDRTEAQRPPPQLDPHRPFVAQGLYRQGLHGELPTIPWYAVLGNHDHFALGNFQVFELPDGQRVAPVPVPLVLGALFPTSLDPTGTIGFGLISPGHPGPPDVLNLGQRTAGNPDRRYCTSREVIELHHLSPAEPAGHGFEPPESGPTWYSTVPVAGLRLIVLDTSRPAHHLPGVPYVAGSLQADQVEFLRQELERADRRGQWVVLASHHPSQDLATELGTAVTGDELRRMLSDHPRVLLHLAGHTHRHRVIDRGGYLEIETGSTLDWPQEGRFIELWESAEGSEVLVRYRMFSHLPESPDERDELYDLRAAALALAREDAPRAAAAAAAALPGGEALPAPRPLPAGARAADARRREDAGPPDDEERLTPAIDPQRYLAGEPDDREAGRLLRR